MFIALAQCASAQVVRFSLVDVANGAPLEGVEVFSHEDHKKISYSDKFGVVSFDTDHTDTLIFFKKNYHPLYIQVRHNNFDTAHTVILKMSSAKGFAHPKTMSKFDKFQASQHHFTHDSLDNSTIHITQYHPTEPLPVYNDRAFHVVEIGLDKKSPRKRTSYVRQE